MTHFPSSLWPCHLAILSETAALRAFLPLFKDNTSHALPGLFSRHIGSIVPVLVGITATGEEAHHRISALHCLRLLRDMGTLPAHERLMQQSTIVRGIKPALDDSRKAVRIAAVDCRNAWILL